MADRQFIFAADALRLIETAGGFTADEASRALCIALVEERVFARGRRQVVYYDPRSRVLTDEPMSTEFRDIDRWQWDEIAGMKGWGRRILVTLPEHPPGSARLEFERGEAEILHDFSERGSDFPCSAKRVFLLSLRVDREGAEALAYHYQLPTAAKRAPEFVPAPLTDAEMRGWIRQYPGRAWRTAWEDNWRGSGWARDAFGDLWEEERGKGPQGPQGA